MLLPRSSFEHTVAHYITRNHCKYDTAVGRPSLRIPAPLLTYFEHEEEVVVENLLVVVLLSFLLHVGNHRHVELDLPGLVLNGGQEPCLLRNKLPRVLRRSAANKKQRVRYPFDQNLG